jgi:hypothetical protein
MNSWDQLCDRKAIAISDTGVSRQSSMRRKSQDGVLSVDMRAVLTIACMRDRVRVASRSRARTIRATLRVQSTNADREVSFHFAGTYLGRYVRLHYYG